MPRSPDRLESAREQAIGTSIQSMLWSPCSTDNRGGSFLEPCVDDDSFLDDYSGRSEESIELYLLGKQKQLANMERESTRNKVTKKERQSYSSTHVDSAYMDEVDSASRTAKPKVVKDDWNDQVDGLLSFLDHFSFSTKKPQQITDGSPSIQSSFLPCPVVLRDSSNAKTEDKNKESDTTTKKVVKHAPIPQEVVQSKSINQVRKTLSADIEEELKELETSMERNREKYLLNVSKDTSNSNSLLEKSYDTIQSEQQQQQQQPKQKHVSQQEKSKSSPRRGKLKHHDTSKGKSMLQDLEDSIEENVRLANSSHRSAKKSRKPHTRLPEAATHDPNVDLSVEETHIMNLINEAEEKSFAKSKRKQKSKERAKKLPVNKDWYKSRSKHTQHDDDDDVSVHSDVPIQDEMVLMLRKEAQEERDQAREWAGKMRRAVQEWQAHKQTSAVQPNTAASDKAYKEAVHSLENTVALLKGELRHSLDHYLHVERQLHDIIARQQETIKQLEDSLAKKSPGLDLNQSQSIALDDLPNMTPLPTKSRRAKSPDTLASQMGVEVSIKQPSSAGSYSGGKPPLASSNDRKYENRSNYPTQHSSDQTSPQRLATAVKTPQSWTRKENNNIPPSRRSRSTTPTGHHLVRYSNGSHKQVHPDGTTVITFANGDLQTLRPNGNASTYFYAASKVWQTTMSDGSVQWEFPNGQVENHLPDGSKTVYFPDGSTSRVNPDGSTVSNSIIGQPSGSETGSATVQPATRLYK